MDLSSYLELYRALGASREVFVLSIPTEAFITTDIQALTSIDFNWNLLVILLLHKHFLIEKNMFLTASFQPSCFNLVKTPCSSVVPLTGEVIGVSNGRRSKSIILNKMLTLATNYRGSLSTFAFPEQFPEVCLLGTCCIAPQERTFLSLEVFSLPIWSQAHASETFLWQVGDDSQEGNVLMSCQNAKCEVLTWCK